MPVTGWRYFKWGTCPDCGDADAYLRRPVLVGEEFTDERGRTFLRGAFLDHFDGVCQGCSVKYTLDVLCESHRYPLKVKDARCKLCPR